MRIRICMHSYSEHTHTNPSISILLHTTRLQTASSNDYIANSKPPSNPTHWADSLPLVLLGIRTALNEDINCTSAELVYGTSLCLPSDFFDHTKDGAAADPAAYVQNLKCTMQQLKASPVHSHPQRKVHISNALATCTHVFVCCDAIHKPLQPPYDGLLEHSDKYFVVGGQDTISLDRLKPAHLNANESSETTSSTFIKHPSTCHRTSTDYSSHSVWNERHVHCPVHFANDCLSAHRRGVAHEHHMINT